MRAMTGNEGNAPARIWRAFIEWFWRPSWDADLPDDPQARYFARKEHNRLIRRRLLFIALLIVVIGVIVHAANAEPAYEVYDHCLVTANNPATCPSPSP